MMIGTQTPCSCRERERERAIFSKIKEGRNTFVCHIKKAGNLSRNT